MAYASSPLMLAIDRRISNIPLEKRLRARTSHLEAWNKTMLPTIRLSISQAQNQILTGHQDIRTSFLRQGSASTKHERNARYRDRNDRHHEPRPHRTSPNRPSTTTAT
jgi:hypothetical protein